VPPPWIIAVIVPLGVIAIPIVAILSAHQRKMAEILHRNQPMHSGELEAIRQEMRELRMLMNQHTIALDDVRSRQGMSALKSDIEQRLGTQ
jgi:hypothetical protein